MSLTSSAVARCRLPILHPHFLAFSRKNEEGGEKTIYRSVVFYSDEWRAHICVGLGGYWYPYTHYARLCRAHSAPAAAVCRRHPPAALIDRKSTRLNSSHHSISYS